MAEYHIVFPGDVESVFTSEELEENGIETFGLGDNVDFAVISPQLWAKLRVVLEAPNRKLFHLSKLETEIDKLRGTKTVKEWLDYDLGS